MNNALRLTKVTDANNKVLSAERVTQDSSVRIPLAAGLPKDASTTMTFDYEGVLNSADESPVQGLKLASIGDDTTYLLYAARWFPVSGYGLNRFTSTISVTVPSHMVAIGSGKMTVADSAPSKKSPGALAGKTYTFVSDRPSFPGTIIAGVFQETKSEDAGLDLHVFFKPLHQKLAPEYTNAALKEFTYYITAFGPLPSPTLRVVELPDDTVPTAWAPEIAAVAGGRSPTKPTTACLPIPSRISGGVVRSVPQPRKTGGSATASRAIPKPCTSSRPPARWAWKKR